MICKGVFSGKADDAGVLAPAKEKKAVSCRTAVENQDVYSNMPNWLETTIKTYIKDDLYIECINKLIEISCKLQENLTRCFKKYMAVSSTEFNNNLRLNKAVFLLTYTLKSILQISLESGFENISYFNKLFKQKFKVDPNFYRKTIYNSI